LQLGDLVDASLRKWLRANDHFVFGRSGKHKLRFQQRAELGNERSDKYCHHAGDIHVHIGDRFDECESYGDDHLHAHGNQCRWLSHLYANRYGKHGKHTKDQLLRSQSDKYQSGFQQHAELGDKRGDEYCHHAGDIHVHFGERFDQREPNGDNHLHAHGNQCHRLDHIHGNRNCNRARRSAGDHNHFVPRRDTRRGVCRLHNSRQWRHSALYVFAKRIR